MGKYKNINKYTVKILISKWKYLFNNEDHLPIEFCAIIFAVQENSLKKWLVLIMKI